MTYEEFYNEAIASSYKSDEFEFAWKGWRDYQQIYVDILNEFNRVCHKNGITYQLGYGSLLGMIREEEGICPWGDDADVIAPYEEKDRLIDALARDLDYKYCFVSPDTHPRFWGMMIRISPKPYSAGIVFLDVFFAIGAPSHSNERKKMKGDINELLTYRDRKMNSWRYVMKDYRSLKTYFIIYAAKIRRMTKSLKRINKELEVIMTKYEPRETNWSDLVCRIYKKPLDLETDLLWDTELVTKAIGTFPVCKHYEKLLNQIYGENWRQPPKIEERIDDVIHTYKLYNIYRSGEIISLD